MKILISPYSRAMRDGKKNPKNFPYWKDVVLALINLGHEVIQLGAGDEPAIDGVSEFKKDLSLAKLKELLESADTWASVDNFFQHFCHLHNKSGVVVFGRSNPKIFGYPENTNLLKDPSYLREKQFDIWESTDYCEDVFISANVVVNAILGVSNV